MVGAWLPPIRYDSRSKVVIFLEPWSTLNPPLGSEPRPVQGRASLLPLESFTNWLKKEFFNSAEGSS